MIYMVTVDGNYIGHSSSAKKAIALGYCKVGRREEVADHKTFLHTVRGIKKDLKKAESYEIEARPNAEYQNAKIAQVQLVSMKAVERILADEFAIVYEPGD